MAPLFVMASNSNSNQTETVEIYLEDWHKLLAIAQKLSWKSENKADLIHQLLHSSPTGYEMEEVTSGSSAHSSSENLLSKQAFQAFTEFFQMLKTLLAVMNDSQTEQLKTLQHIQALVAAMPQFKTDAPNTTIPQVLTPKTDFGAVKLTPKLTARQKLLLAFESIVDYNEVPGRSPSEKWAINQNVLAELTGCNRPAIKRFLEDYAHKITVHHEANNISARQNYTHGQQGIKIKDVISAG